MEMMEEVIKPKLETRRRGPVVRLQSWFSWRRSSTAEKMDELIARISDHLASERAEDDHDP